MLVTYYTNVRLIKKNLFDNEGLKFRSKSIKQYFGGSIFGVPVNRDNVDYRLSMIDNFTIDQIRDEIIKFKNDPDFQKLENFYSKSFSEILGVSR